MHCRFFPYILVCVLAALFLYPAGIQAENDKGTEITSRDMTFKGAENLIVFSGDVYVRRPDFELWSDKLYVYLRSDADMDETAPEAGEDDDIEKIVARGQVRIQGEGREGRSGLLTYYPDTEIVELEQDPRLIEGKNSVEGEKIVLNLKDNTSRVYGSEERRVRVIFHSDDSDGDGQ
ncbi:OstA family protein [Desulfonatronospira thiodismutans ASO3-1]|uniref:OstA family protein n=2 Tax=Desulfonatronospira thiodismutans TaxID=488939 RepID=D6SSF1_9BACT|nr:LptA/OstA family protein [Desulfonatronospira sp. MSAO_Bac3]EFI33617.1 OstA family protein [Desulfonatronospira thiodismutans ASO3-1]